MRFLVLLTFIFCACTSFEHLTLERSNLAPGTLRLNGYYYERSNGRFNAFFLSSNGVFRGFSSGVDTLDMKGLDKQVGGAFPKEFDVRYAWGVFQVNGNEIEIERWLPGTGLLYTTQLLKGRVLNDSTIHIFLRIGDDSSINNKPQYEVNEIYRFRSLSLKPDSVSIFTE
ncbi:hypothetical protein WBG78_28980 [Chryseolinea sp. T2]|uniref:hypothetical protein n=1 Tax=Chryseolinea sp. T2 TaxID=3129255 RepID=UPI003077A78B